MFSFDLGALDLNDAEVEAFLDDPEAEDLLQDVVDDMAAAARPAAPKESGEGAASIHGEVHRGAPSTAFAGTYTPEDPGELIGYVSWSQEHYYMGFHELGTADQPARPFLRPALDQTQV